MKAGPLRLLVLVVALAAAGVVDRNSLSDRRDRRHAEAAVLETVRRIGALEAPATLGDVARVLREQAGAGDPLLLVYTPADAPTVLPYRLEPEVFSRVRVLLDLPSGTPMMVPNRAAVAWNGGSGNPAGREFRIVHRDSVWLPDGRPGEIIAIARRRD
jgi:hypothetical protein